MWLELLSVSVRFGGKESVAKFMARVAEVWDECLGPAEPRRMREARVAQRSAQVKEEPAQRAGDTEQNAGPTQLRANAQHLQTK